MKNVAGLWCWWREASNQPCVKLDEDIEDLGTTDQRLQQIFTCSESALMDLRRSIKADKKKLHGLRTGNMLYMLTVRNEALYFIAGIDSTFSIEPALKICHRHSEPVQKLASTLFETFIGKPNSTLEAMISFQRVYILGPEHCFERHQHRACSCPSEDTDHPILAAAVDRVNHTKLLGDNLFQLLHRACQTYDLNLSRLSAIKLELRHDRVGFNIPSSGEVSHEEARWLLRNEARSSRETLTELSKECQTLLKRLHDACRRGRAQNEVLRASENLLTKGVQVDQNGLGPVPASISEERLAQSAISLFTEDGMSPSGGGEPRHTVNNCSAHEHTTVDPRALILRPSMTALTNGRPA